MTPLIVAATEAELAPSISFLKEMQIPYLLTGVGMTATAFHLGKALSNSKPAFIINVGIAGAFCKDVPLGTVVHILTDTFAELGAEDDKDFLPIENLGFGQSMFEANIPTGVTLDIRQCNGITVNRVHGNEDSIAAIRTIYPHADIESMEGAAVLYACAEEKIPCIQIRAISNYVEKRNRANWNIPLAVKNLNEWLQGFLLSGSC